MRKFLFASKLHLFLIVAVIEACIVCVLYRLAPVPFSFYINKAVNAEMFTFLTFMILFGWLGILIGYYVWSIYYYNINLGYSDSEWDAIHRKIEESKQRKALGEIVKDEDLVSPTDNPYKDETFGLPPGTVRGTIALSILLGGMAILVYSLGPDAKNVSTELEFFRTAFLMMIAFYFGAKSLQDIRGSSDKTAAAAAAASAPPPPPPLDAPAPLIVAASEPATTLSSSMGVAAPTITSNTFLPDVLIAKPAEQPTIVPDALVQKSIEKTKAQQGLSDETIQKVSGEYGLGTAEVKAVMKVESNGSGYLEDGRLRILFEGQKFYKHLAEKQMKPELLAPEHPDILHPSQTYKYYKKGAAEYERLDKAKLIDKDSALMSASWGLFQILGENYKECGFNDVQSFVDYMGESEENQLRAFFNYLKSRKLIDALSQHDWKTFASKYNGPNYALNKYDIRMSEAYSSYLEKESPTISATITRDKDQKLQTLGELKIMNQGNVMFTCKTLELPWKDNQKQISCIPTGTYKVQKLYSDERKGHFYLENVPNREGILIHSGNYISQTRGCVLVGQAHADINTDGLKDVTNSKITLEKLYGMMPDKFDLTIS